VNANLIPRRTPVGKRRLADWWAILAIFVVCLALAVGGDAVRELARYERVGLEGGQYWRLLSGHLVHLGWGHLWPNLAALLIVAALFEGVYRSADWLLLGLISAASIDAGLYFLDPTVRWYVGLSGVLHGFVAAGAVEALLRGQTFGALLAIGVCGKLIFEQLFGPVPFTAASVGGPVVVAAHLYGAAGGFVFAAGKRFAGRRGSRV
jgi:rhomboid family GlyGly-CTERM serine protease